MRHYRYGGSTAERTLSCSGWRRLADVLDYNADTTAAQIGTMLHKAMELIFHGDSLVLNIEELKADIMNVSYKEHIMTEEHYKEKIVPAFKAVTSVFKNFEVASFDVEKEVRTNAFIGGTADMLGVGYVGAAKKKTVFCLDYKFGYQDVLAKDHTPSKFYLQNAKKCPEYSDHINESDYVTIFIVQPDKEDGAKASIVPTKELESFEREFLSAVEASEFETDSFSAGEWCQFCPGRGLCPATSHEIKSIEDLKLPEVNKLMSKYDIPDFERLRRIKSYIKSLEDLVLSYKIDGYEIDGYGASPKSAQRVYTDKEEVINTLKCEFEMEADMYLKTELKSPAQLEKLFKSMELNFDSIDMLIEHKSSGFRLSKPEEK